MTAHVALRDRDALALADEYLGRELQALGYERAEVRSGLDQTGDDALFITVVLKPRAAALDAVFVNRIARELDDILLEHGEERLTYLRWRRPDDLPVDE